MSINILAGLSFAHIVLLLLDTESLLALVLSLGFGLAELFHFTELACLLFGGLACSFLSLLALALALHLLGKLLQTLGLDIW